MTANPDPLYTIAKELRTVADLGLRFSKTSTRSGTCASRYHGHHLTDVVQF